MNNGNFAKLSAACGFALKVVKYQNDDKITEVIEERESTDSDRLIRTHRALSPLIHILSLCTKKFQGV
jgi:hypothetical protein